MKSTHQRRKSYGRPPLIDTIYDDLMSKFLASGKKQPEYWAENIRRSNQPVMTYETFKTRVRDFLQRTNQVLSVAQLARIRLPDPVIQRYALLYLDIAEAKGTAVINKAQFFEEYIIVPPYDEVPSYEQFMKKLDPMLKHLQQKRSRSDDDAAINSGASATEAILSTGSTRFMGRCDPPVLELVLGDEFCSTNGIVSSAIGSG